MSEEKTIRLNVARHISLSGSAPRDYTREPGPRPSARRRCNSNSHIPQPLTMSDADVDMLRLVSVQAHRYLVAGRQS